MQNNQSQVEDGSVIRVEDNFVDPTRLIKKVGIKSGDRVADFGCGPGYFSIPIAKTIGEDGEVFAFDVLPSALSALESQAKIQGVDNIAIKRVNLEKKQGTRLENESVDWVVLKNILFQNDKKRNIIKEAYRILRKGGKILIMEWDKNLSVGPAQKMRISPQELIEIIDREEFIFEKQLPAGNYHYVIIAVKL